VILVCCYVISVYAGFNNRELYKFLLKEDGPLENIASACVLFASLLFLFAYFKHRYVKNTFFLLFSIALFILFMEEISWGQRIFGFQSPDIFQQSNAQKEINLHNLRGIYRFINELFYVCLEFYLVGIFLIVLIFKDLHTLLLRYRVPIPSAATAFLVFINFLMFVYFFQFPLSYYDLLGTRVVNFTEIYETGIEISLLFFALECFHRGTTWLNHEDVMGANYKY
jgi:hypothetical protein